MKAAITTKYGSPDVIQIQDVEKPSFKDTEILVKVRTSSVGPANVAFMRGDPFIVRLMYGLNKPKMSIGGNEFAGEIEAVGKDVKNFKVGDKVYGLTMHSAHAEYLVLPEDTTVVTKSAKMSDEEAVGIADGGLTSLTFLRDIAKLQTGQKVLINGASGAVGVYGVQLAKYFGAEVTGVCSGKNVELVKSLGADKVIDYTKSDFTKNTETYDVIFDAVGKSSFSACKNVLKPNGLYLTTVPTLAIVRDMLWTSIVGSKKAKLVTAGLMQNKDNFKFLNGLFDAGKIKAVIDKTYPLDTIADAYRYVETGRKKGNVIIQI